MPPNDRFLTLESLRQKIETDQIDTVVLAFTDMQGRLQGKRLHARYFLDVALEAGTEGCNYLLAVDIDMNTVDGYTISSWEKGYGDMEFVPDYETIRLLPHLPGSVLVQCDLVWLDHAPVPQSPRTILKTQLERVAEMGMVALAGTELEFIAFDTSYEEAHDRRWRDLTPVNQYNVDYSILGTARVEPLLRDLRNHMYAAGLDVEGAKGECNFGQHEIGFLYADALTTADNHSVYKIVAKEIAAQRGQAITFMAKYDQREGNSCHIHLSLRGDDGAGRVLGRGRGGSPHAALRPVHRRRARDDARLHAALRPERQLLQAVRGRLLRSDGDRLGARQPHLCGPAGRVTARAPGWRTACRVATSTPTSRWRRCWPGACYGIEHELELEDELVGNAYTSDAEHVPAHPAGRPRRLPRVGDSRVRRSATTSSTTTRTWPTSSSRPSTRR